MKYLDLKDLSYNLQANCFYLYLILYTWAARFNVTENLKKFLIFKVN
jgi:hypothetical protein